MTHQPTSFRLDPALLARVDKYAADMAVARGVRVSRHSAMAELLTFALNANEQLLALNKALRKRQKSKKK
jgi:hypothetical protein